MPNKKGLFPKKKSKVQIWNEVRAELKKEFESKGITFCELRWRGCWVNSSLGFAHSKPRRFITTDEDLKTVILACNECHFILDNNHTKESTEKIVLDIISKRNRS